MSVAARRRLLTPWAVTITATAASTYALDAVATAAGVLLVASHALSGLLHWQALVFLAATYAAWGAGLRVNLQANWSLLERTGTSTNALSKAAHDLTRLRTASVRARRIASSAGYVATELAKEAPYYAGAFGAAVFSDSVSSTDAIVFLAGANLGAAAYEYGLARLTRTALRLRAERACASFDTDWVPGEYLTEYYSEVEPDERETIAYFVDAMRHVEPGAPILFFGVGPTLHHVFLAAGTASEIHLADYLPANLAEIERWLARDPGAHDWRPFVRYTLECEGVADPTDEQISRREELTRSRITQLLQADARLPEPVARRYGTVVSAYCADSATGDRGTWESFMRHISGLVQPGGVFITSALRRCRFYLVGGKPFPSADVDEHDLRALLELDFDPASGSIEVRDLAEHEAQGYSSIVLAWRRRREDARPTFPKERGSDKSTSTQPTEGGSSMSRINLRRALVTLAVTASVITMLDYEGTAFAAQESPLPAGACATEGAVGIPYRNGINCRVVEVDGHPRRFVVYVPQQRPVTGPLRPVVFMFHGSTGTGEQFLGSSGWREQADSTGLVAVFPTGLRYRVLDSGRLSTKWNAFDLAGEVDLDERPPGYPDDAPWPADDVGFVDSIMGDLGARLPIDRRRVYASGFSNGAGFAARLAVERSHVLAAAAFAGSALPAAQVPLRPTPMWLVAGALDDRILAQTGPPPLTELPLDPAALLAEPVVDSAIDAHLATAGLDEHLVGTLALPDSTAFRWPAIGEGPGGGVFRFSLLAGLGHSYPHAHNNDAGFEAAPEFWDFFRTHRLP